MAVTAHMFNGAPHNAYHAKFNDLTDVGTTIKCALLTTGTAIDQTYDTWHDVVNEAGGSHEVAAAGGYTAGGTTLTTPTLTVTDHVTTFNADDALWAASTITAAYAVVYDATEADDADQKLLVLVDFGGSFSSTAGDFQITWAAGGIFTDTVDGI